MAKVLDMVQQIQILRPCWDVDDYRMAWFLCMLSLYLTFVALSV